MGIAAEIYDLMLESTQENPFSEEMINAYLYDKLSSLLYQCDGELSAQAHGRPPASKDELKRLSYGLRDIADDLANCRSR